MARKGWTLGALAFVALLVSLGVLWAHPPEAAARGDFIHAAAQQCSDCHHGTSYGKCSSCHTKAVAQTACTSCHTTFTTSGGESGPDCWTCHIPGDGPPPATDDGCRGCHGSKPHLGSSLQCTSCHSLEQPTAHHDAIDQQKPTKCTDCHETVLSHGSRDCTTCHATSPHPNIPTTPDVCNTCHAAEVFNGRGDCVACHTAGGGFAGVSDEDIHDNAIPDAPIGGSACTSCHADKNQHANKVACVECHDQAVPFHHGTAASPGFPSCTTCHGEKLQHGAGTTCTTCHGEAQHKTKPLEPSPSIGCPTCHSSAVKGTKDCLTCHKPPIYHVPPSVGDCTTCHGTSRAKHAGKVQCTQCHTNVDKGHHLTSVVRPACNTAGCHASYEPHQPTVTCTSCHGSKAVHDSTPRNLPANPWSVCGKCHSFVPAAIAAGVPACSQCHQAAQHDADYRLPACTSCHTNKAKHAGKVACQSCHTNLAKGHHRAGKVSTRACSDCHTKAGIHASATVKGAAFTCGTCHEGTVHGVLTLPGPGRCIECHQEAPKHAGDMACTDCHWPAAHSTKPDASVFGSYEPMTVSPAAVPPSDGEPRDWFVKTGMDVLALIAAAAALVTLGLLLRRRRP